MINWNKRKYSKEEFTKAWESSKTIRQVGLKLDLYMTGDAYRNVQEAAKDLSLSSAHMITYGLNTTNNKNQHSANKLETILIKNSTYSNTSVLKQRLIQAELLNNICAICKIKPFWNNKPLVLRLDHISGVHDDHRLENLRLLCPNCDSQQPTYQGRNKGH